MGKRQALKAVERELAKDAEALGEPEPQAAVELDTAAMLRLGHSNDWRRAEVNARINRGVMERQRKSEKEIAEVLKPFTEQMERAGIAVAVIDTEFPNAKARAREIIESHRKARERIKAGNPVACPQCGHEFTEVLP